MDLQKIISDANNLRKGNILSQFGVSNEQTSDEVVKANADAIEDEIVKSIMEMEEEVEENPFEKAVNEEADSEVEKGEIFDAINYNSNIKFNKTGKELKENVAAKVLPNLNTLLSTYQTEADTLLSVCGNAPTKPADYWYTREMKIDVPYKVYDWDETYFDNEKKNGTIVESLSVEQAENNKAIAKNYPASKEQGDNRRSYNDKVRAICDILVDIKACELISNIPDEEKIELTPRQYLTFQF